MNILLTGSGGFIGKNLKTFLEGKYTLFTPRSFELDLTDREAVKVFFENQDVDFIIHCGTVGGARGVQDKDTTVEDNLGMINNLLDYKKTNCRMITFGSGAMYDRKRNLHKVSEKDIGSFIPSELYGLSKMKQAELVMNRDDILMLNIFACYGYGEKESRFPSYAIHQNLEHLPIEINQNVVFDYLFVEDMQKIIAYFIEHKPEDKIINITPTNSVSLKEIAEIVNNISDYRSQIVVKNPVMNFEYTGDNTLLLKNIPNFEFTSMEQGIKALYNHISLEKDRNE